LNSKIVIYADLDGTILDETYSFKKIQPILQELKSLNAAIVLNSSKTRSEIEHYREQMGIIDPFIAENGSATYIPKNYFKADHECTRETAQYSIIELGTPYSTIRRKLQTIKAESKAEIVGFGDMTTQELAKDTGLPLNQAELAKKREYDEVFKIVSGDEADVLRAIASQGLKYTKGNRYYHLLGDTDKGQALQTLTGLYQKDYNNVLTIGVGDSPNDQPMLALVDRPFLVKDAPLPVWKDILKLAQTYM